MVSLPDRVSEGEDKQLACLILHPSEWARFKERQELSMQASSLLLSRVRSVEGLCVITFVVSSATLILVLYALLR